MPGAPARLTARIETWLVAGSFVIARGAKAQVEIILVEIDDGRHLGRGEATAIDYHGESARSVLAQVEAMAKQIAARIGRDQLLERRPRGAARKVLAARLEQRDDLFVFGFWLWGGGVWAPSQRAGFASCSGARLCVLVKSYRLTRRTRKKSSGGSSAAARASLSWPRPRIR